MTTSYIAHRALTTSGGSGTPTLGTVSGESTIPASLSNADLTIDGSGIGIYNGEYHVKVTATAGAESINGIIPVTVTGKVPLPVINSFTCDPISITEGSSSTLNWSVLGAVSLSIGQGVGTVTGTSFVVTPVSTTTYTLTATNSGGSVTATTTVSVTAIPYPIIEMPQDQFGGYGPFPYAGGSKTLIYRCYNVTSLIFETYALEHGSLSSLISSENIAFNSQYGYGFQKVVTVGSHLPPFHYIVYRLRGFNSELPGQESFRDTTIGCTSVQSFSASPVIWTDGGNVTLTIVADTGQSYHIAAFNGYNNIIETINVGELRTFIKNPAAQWYRLYSFQLDDPDAWVLNCNGTSSHL